MNVLIVDTASDPTPKLPQLWSAGVRSIFGYMSSIDPTGGKCWTVARVKAAAAAGFYIGLVHEGFGGVGGKGISAADGLRDGTFARAKAAELGAPQSAAIYFACDIDFTATAITRQVLPYFEAIQQAQSDGFYRVGVYGSGAVCASLIDAQLVDLTWEAQSRGWMSYSAWLAKADMVQGAETTLAGLEVDTDAYGVDLADYDIGDYVPVFAGAAA